MEAAESLQNDAKSDKAAKFYEQALLLVDCCKIPEAIKLLEKAIELNPDSEIYKETLAFFQMNTQCYTDHLSKDKQGSSYASVTRTKNDASYKKVKSSPEWNVKKTKSKENPAAKMPWTPDVSSSYYSDPYEQATIENPWASFVNSSYRRKKPDRSPIDGLSEIELPNGSKVESPLSTENSFSSMLKTPISSHETIDDDSGSSGHEHENHADVSGDHFGYKNGAYPEGIKDDHDENLEKTFLEELCKARETALDDWAKYYEMLYSGLSKEGVPSTQSDTLGQKVHVPTTQYSDSLDDVDESPSVSHRKEASSSEKPTSKSNNNVCSKCGHFIGSGNPPPSPTKNRIHFVNGACVSSSNVSYCTCNKQSKDNSEQQSTRSQLSSSQQEFYRNLQSYFGNGKVKSRKTEESSSKGNSDDLDLHSTMTCNSRDTNISANVTKEPSKVTLNQNVTESAKDGSVQSESRTYKEHVRYETKNESTLTEGVKKDKKSHSEERFQRTSFKPKSKVDEKVKSRPKASKAEHVKNSKEGVSRSDSHRQARAKVGVKSRVSHRVKAEDPAKTVPGADVKERSSKHRTAEKAEANTDFTKLFYSVYCTGLSLLSKSGQAFKSIIYYVLLLMVLLFGFVLYCAWFACCWSCRKVLQYIPAERLLVYVRSKGSSLYEWFKKCREKRKTSEGGQTYDLPKNGDAAVTHMLQNKDSDPYSVLGVPKDATDDDIRKQYRRLAVLIHPDKNTHPQADEAFKTLANAFDILSDPVKRSNFDTEEAWKRRAEDREAHYGRGPTSPEQFFADLGRKMQEMQNYLHCNACDGKHRRYSTDRFILTARFCGRCNTRHSAKEGDLWAESSFLGYKLHFYACMEGEVFDVTEWAACQGIGSYRVEPNPHTVHLKLKTRQSNPSGFNSRAEEKDFENFMRAFFGQPPDRERYHGTSKPQKRRRKRKH